MAIVELHWRVRRILPIVALIGLLPTNSAEAQIKLSPGRVPIGDNELNSPIDEPQVTLDEHSSNAVMRPVPLVIQQAKDPLVKLVYETREAQRRRLLSTAEHTPWQIMHGMLALREEFLIRHDGKPVSCLEWIKSGPTFENESWFEKTQVRVLTGRGGNNAWEMMTVGRGHPYNKPYAFEGHINQFVAILSMSGVPLETQFNTPQGPVSMRDMLTYAKMTVNEKEEVTWTLWALSRYLPPDAEWTNAHGEKWSIERLVKIETAKSLQGAPCGGTHGLFALAHARNVYLRTGKPLVGAWLEAEQKIRRYIQTARMQQNSNGTLSSNYFRGREFKQDFDKRLASSGHLLEFLMMALPSQELNAPWVRRAIEATSNDLMANRKAYVSCSPLYHATSGLSIYLDRINAVAPNVAQGVPKTHTISNSKEIRSADAAFASPPADPPETVKAEIANPEAVSTPVLESSGVDSNGAPKALTGPVTTVPDVPEKPAIEPMPVSSDEIPQPMPAVLPVPEETVPLGSKSGQPKADAPPIAMPIPAESDVKSTDEATTPKPQVEPALPGLVAVPTDSVSDSPSPLPVKAESVPTVTSTPAPAESALRPADGTGKIRVFGPTPARETHIKSQSHQSSETIRIPAPPAGTAESFRSNSGPDVNVARQSSVVADQEDATSEPAPDTQIPSTPVPNVPLPGEFLVVPPEVQLVPTPSVDLSSEPPVLTIPGTPPVDLTDFTSGRSDSSLESAATESLVISAQSAANSRVLPNETDKRHLPTNRPRDKKNEGWKATPHERRKPIAVEGKKTDV